MESVLLLIEKMETAVDVVGMVQTVWACMFEFDYAEGMSCRVNGGQRPAAAHRLPAEYQ